MFLFLYEYLDIYMHVNNYVYLQISAIFIRVKFPDEMTNTQWPRAIELL